MNVANKHFKEIVYNDMNALKANLGVTQKAYEKGTGKSAYRHNSGANDFYVYPREGGDAEFADVIVDNLKITNVAYYDKLAYIDVAGNVTGTNITPGGDSQLELSTRVDGWLKKQWTLLNRSETNFITNFGDYSVDLSSSFADATIDYNVGAVANNVFMSGQNNLSLGMYSVVGGYGNIIAGYLDSGSNEIRGGTASAVFGFKNQVGVYHTNISNTDSLINPSGKITNLVAGHNNFVNSAYSIIGGSYNMINIVFPVGTYTGSTINYTSLVPYYRHLTGLETNKLQAYINNSGLDLTTDQLVDGGRHAISTGERNIVYGYNCSVFGSNNTISHLANKMLVVGEDNYVEGERGIVSGMGNILLNSEGVSARGNFCFVSGLSNTVSGFASNAIGQTNNVYGSQCTAIGLSNVQSGSNGFCNLMSGHYNSIVDGSGNFISGQSNQLSAHSLFSTLLGSGHNCKGNGLLIAGSSNLVGTNAAKSISLATAFGHLNYINGSGGLTVGNFNDVKSNMSFTRGDSNFMGTNRSGFNASISGTQNFAVSSYANIHGVANVVGLTSKNIVRIDGVSAVAGEYLYQGNTPDGNRSYLNMTNMTHWLVRNFEDTAWAITTSQTNPAGLVGILYYKMDTVVDGFIIDEEVGSYVELPGFDNPVNVYAEDTYSEMGVAFGHSNAAYGFASKAMGVGCISGNYQPENPTYDAFLADCLKSEYNDNGSMIAIADVETLNSMSLDYDIPLRFKSKGVGSLSSGVKCIAYGSGSHALGIMNITYNFGECAVGVMNSIISEAMFNVGIGDISTGRFNGLTVLRTGEISHSNLKTNGSLNETILKRFDITVNATETIEVEMFPVGTTFPRIYISYDYMIDVDDTTINSYHRLRAGKLMIIADATNQQIDVTEIETDDLNGDTSFVTFSAVYDMSGNIVVSITNADLVLNAVVMLRKQTMF